MTWLLFSFGIVAAAFQISLGAALPWLDMPLLEKLLLGDLFIPPLALLCLIRFGRQGLPRFYLAVSSLLFLLHFSRQDAPYWLGQVVHGLTYYIFLIASKNFSSQRVARSVAYCWMGSLPLLLLYGLIAHVQMGRHMGEYSTMSILLTERYQLLAGNPNKLVAFHLFIGLCFALGWRNRPLSKAALTGLGLLLLTTVLTKSRDVPLVILLCLRALWPAVGRIKLRLSLFLLGAGCVLVSGFGTLAIYWSVLPLQNTYPFLNLRHPSSYWARSQYPYVRMLTDASPAQLLAGRGYAGLPEPYHRLKSPEMIKDALSTYENGPSVDHHPWLYIHSPPHNSWLLILNAGGLLWLSGLVSVIFRTKGSRKTDYLFLACLFVESLSHDNIHYPWPFAGIGMLHALEQHSVRPPCAGS